MSQNVTLTLYQQKQWKIWKEGKNRGLTDTQIAKLMHRSRPTVDRLKRKAKKTGDYQAWADETLNWAQEEFRELHPHIKAESPNLAYAWMGRLAEKSLVSYTETRTEITEKKEIKIDLNVFTDDEKSILDRAARLLDRKSKRKLSNIH